MSNLRLTAYFEDRTKTFAFDVINTATLGDLKEKLASLVNTIPALIAVHSATRVEYNNDVASLATLGLQDDDRLIVTVKAVTVRSDMGKRARYEIELDKTSGDQLKQLVSGSFGFSHGRILLFRGATEITGALLSNQGILYGQEIQIEITGPRYVILEVRSINAGKLGHGIPFRSATGSSTSPARVLNTCDTIDEACAIVERATGATIGIPLFDRITKSYDLYTNGPVNFRAFDIGEFPK